MPDQAPNTKPDLNSKTPPENKETPGRQDATITMSSDEPKECTASNTAAVKPAVLKPGEVSKTPLAPYTAEEAAGFARQGASMVAWPHDEVWVDPFKNDKGKEGKGK